MTKLQKVNYIILDESDNNDAHLTTKLLNWHAFGFHATFNNVQKAPNDNNKFPVYVILLNTFFLHFSINCVKYFDVISVLLRKIIII